MSTRHVALLRAINVGGKNKLAMKALVAIFEDVGCREVRTYVQSGNVVYAAPSSLAARVPKLVEEAIAEHHGLRVPVIVRTADALARVVRENPFLALSEAPAQLHVAFLADAPSEAQIAALDPNRSPGDRYEVRGSEIHLCLPNGAARTKLTTAYFDSRLSTTTTVRNWRTVLALDALANGAG